MVVRVMVVVRMVLGTGVDDGDVVGDSGVGVVVGQSIVTGKQIGRAHV